MRKNLALLLLIGILSSGNAWSAGVPVKFPTDSVQFGKSGSTSTKVFGFDFGLGASNPVLQVDNATKTLNYSKNSLSIGDGTSSDKSIAAANGASPAPRMVYSAANQDWEFSNDGTNFTSIGSGSGSGAGFNALANPGFESGVAQGYTTTGGTLAAVSGGANLLVGRGSATFQASASGQSVQSTLYAIPNGLLSRACMAQTLYLGGDANLTFQAIDGSSNVLASTPLTPTTTPKMATIVFLCPSSGSFQWQVKSTASGAIVALDQNFLGENVTVPLSQAQLLGSVTITGCTLPWSTSGTSFAAFATQTGCSYATSGTAQAPATNVPGIKFASIPPGELMLVYEGSVEQTVGNKAGTLQFSDGTNVSREQSVFITTSGGDTTWPGISQSIVYTTAQSNVTLQLFGKNSSGGTLEVFGTTGTPGVIRVYLFPTQSQTAFRADATPASWSGWIGGSSCTPSLTNATPVQDFPTSTCSLTQLYNRNFGTVTEFGSTQQGIVFTPPRIGRYKVDVTVSWSNTGSNISFFSLVDQSGNILDVSETQGQGRATFKMSGQVDASSTSPVTLKIQGATTAGTVNLSAGSNTNYVTNWILQEQDAPTSAPYLQGNVLSTSAGILHVETFAMTGNTACSSSPCTLQSIQTTPGVSTVTRSGTGTYSVNFTASAFSLAPVCTFTQNSNTQTSIAGNFNAATSSAYPLQTYNTGSLSDLNFSGICIGQR